MTETVFKCTSCFYWLKTQVLGDGFWSKMNLLFYQLLHFAKNKLACSHIIVLYKAVCMCVYVSLSIECPAKRRLHQFVNIPPSQSSFSCTNAHKSPEHMTFFYFVIY